MIPGTPPRDYSLAAETPREILANILQGLPNVIATARAYKATCTGADAMFCEVTAVGLEAIEQRLRAALALLETQP